MTYTNTPINFQIEDCEEEIMLAEEGMKETREMLYSFPNDSELKDNLSYYQEEHQYQLARYDALISVKNELEVA